MSLNDAVNENPFLKEQAEDYAKEDDGSEPLLDETVREQQPRRLKDFLFAVLFYIHFIVVFSVAVGYGMPAAADYNDEGSEDEDVDYEGLLAYGSLIGSLALVGGGVGLYVLTKCGGFLIKIALYFSTAVFLLVTISVGASGEWAVFPVFLVAFLSVLCFTLSVRKRIPFATANLRVATTAIMSNRGALGLAYLFGFVTVVWTVIWIVALIGLYDQTSDCKILEVDCDNNPDMFYLFLLLVSFFWTYGVIKNCVHIATVGIVWAWWNSPGERTSCCSSTNKDSFFRATLWSFGSACFGSLILAIIQAIRAILRFIIRQSEGEDTSRACNCLVCCVQCCLSCVEGMFKFANKYAYVYVGMYGYNFISSGRLAMDLFKSRGWTTIISDTMIESALFFVRLGVAGFCGIIGIGIEDSGNHDNWFEAFGSDSQLCAFLIGFLVGYAICGVLFSVIEAAVAAVIVLFADRPDELQLHQPSLFDELKCAYNAAYPEECSENYGEQNRD